MKTLLLVVVILSSFVRKLQGFSINDDNRRDNNHHHLGLSSRRDLVWKIPLGAAATYGYGRLAYNALQIQGIRYPPAHEERVISSISTALLAAAPPAASLAPSDRPFRILEVGVGQDCRVIRRGLYDNGLKQFFQLHPKISEIEVTGVDLQLPKANVVQEAQSRLSTLIPVSDSSTDTSTSINFQAQRGDITTALAYPNGFFDAVVCCLTLCSVSDQTPALTEIRRLIRPSGGTFGYVEHVAVDPSEEDRKLLEFQQRVLDPVQRAVADNCHLHRYTEDAISTIFGVGDENGAIQLQKERFFVESMWPVSCQCCGVVQMNSSIDHSSIATSS